MVNICSVMASLGIWTEFDCLLAFKYYLLLLLFERCPFRSLKLVWAYGTLTLSLTLTQMNYQNNCKTDKRTTNDRLHVHIMNYMYIKSAHTYSVFKSYSHDITKLTYLPWTIMSCNRVNYLHSIGLHTDSHLSSYPSKTNYGQSFAIQLISHVLQIIQDDKHNKINMV